MIHKFSEKRGFSYYVDRLIDEQCVARLERKAKSFNQARQGRKVAIFANEHIGISINQYGCYDRFCLEMLFDFLAPVGAVLEHGTVLDIGANIGNHALFFSPRVGQVLSFEPHPRTFGLLAFNAGTVDNVKAFNFGLGERDETLELNENPENMGASSIRFGNGESARKVAIEVRRLDDVARNLENIELVKIDVEGHEPHVLAGGIEVLRKHQPLILLEQHAGEFCDGSTPSIDLLKGLGYRFCWHQSTTHRKGWVSRRVNTLATMLGKPYEYVIVSDDRVPRATYLMLIAVPPRFQEALGLTH
jgi:FkbM family methyltransferase